MKFNRDGGRRSPAGRPARLSRIAITDTGFGIASDKRAELFVPFARLGAEALTIQGAGLGLAMAKRLTERMRGHIGYESTEGIGSTFWIELPLAESHATVA